MVMSSPMFVHRSKRDLGADPGCQLLQLLQSSWSAVGGAPTSVQVDGRGILHVCVLEGLECNLLSFRGLCVMWGALFQY
jgi:hypothetical protein